MKTWLSRKEFMPPFDKKKIDFIFTSARWGCLSPLGSGRAALAQTVRGSHLSLRWATPFKAFPPDVAVVRVDVIAESMR